MFLLFHRNSHRTSYRFDTFHEPRGVMRILQFVFAVWGFFACRDFSVTLDMDCQEKYFQRRYEIEYPFEFAEHLCRRKTDNLTLFASVDSSTGSQFFVATAVLSLLYALFIIFVYAYLDEMYKSKPEFPMAVRINQCFSLLSIVKGSGRTTNFAIILGLCFDCNSRSLLADWNLCFQQRRKRPEKDF